jgi:hypothetical protein
VPCEPRGELSELLTVQFVEALRHFVSEGIGDNTLWALTSDLAYLAVLDLASSGIPYPVGA